MTFGDTLFGGGGSSGGFEQIPLTKKQKEAEDFLLNLVRNAPNIPAREIAGLTPTEQSAQAKLTGFAGSSQPQILTDALSQLSNILNTSTDVRESPGFRAFSEESERLRDITQSDISRRGQARTGALSFPTAREGAEADVAINRGILAELGRRQELERQVKLQSIPQAINLSQAQTNFPLQQLGAVQQFGALPRNIQQSQEDAIFNQLLQTTLFPFERQAPIAQNILSREAFAFKPGTEGDEGILGSLSKLAGSDTGQQALGSIFGGTGTTQTGTGGTGGTGEDKGGITGQGTSGDIQLALQIAALFSDINLKEDVKTIPNALDKISQIDGKTFKYIDGIQSGGVIAQEIEKIMPDAVGERDGFKTVDYTAIIGLLINSVKELQLEIKELKEN